MKKYEKVALMLMVLGCTLLLLMTTSSDQGNLPTDLLWPGAALTFALLVSSIVVIKMGSERGTGEKVVLFFDFAAKKDPTE